MTKVSEFINKLDAATTMFKLWKTRRNDHIFTFKVQQQYTSFF